MSQISETHITTESLLGSHFSDRQNSMTFPGFPSVLSFFQGTLALELTDSLATMAAVGIGVNTTVSISGFGGWGGGNRVLFRTKLCQFHVVFPENLTTLWEDTPFIY